MRLILAFLIFSQLSYARLLRPLDLPALEETKSNFTPPNETQPQKSLSIIKQAPEGLLISVGTERGFITASMARQITGLLLVDFDQRVVVFNRINTALLQMAKNRKDYIYLRLKAPWYKIQERLLSSKIESYLEPYIKNPAYLDYFRENLAHPDFKNFHNKAAGDEVYDFIGANYLFEDRLFRKIKYLADQGKIEAIGIDLSNLTSVEKLASELRFQNLKISILDLSNCWSNDFIRVKKFSEIINLLSPLSGPKSLLLLTDTIKWYRHRKSSKKSHWNYFGFYLYGLDYTRLMLSYFLDAVEITPGENKLTEHKGLKKNAINGYGDIR